MTGRIGVAGVTGSVGGLAVQELARMGIGQLRLGGRREDELRRIASTLPDAEPVRLDLDDGTDVDHFCAGCDVVLNCAGPSYLILDRLARAASAKGAAYVDVSGDEPVHERMSAAARSTPIVLSAGMLPGLSGLMPRWLAGSLDQADGLSVHIGGLERCSPSSATDMILSMERGESYGQALAAWRAGRVVEKVLRPAKDAEVPFFPDRVTMHPYFGDESARVAAALDLDTMDFWNVFVGDRLPTAFTRLRGRPPVVGAEMDRAVVDLTQAAQLDMFGREPYYTLVFQLTGWVSGSRVVRTAALRTGDAYQLIATVAAQAVWAMADGSVPAGVHYAAEVLEPSEVVDVVRHSEALTTFEVVDQPVVDNAAVMEDGAL